MKKVVLTLTLSVACLAAFGQGRISFQNDSTRLVYYQGVAGQTDGSAVWVNNANGQTWMADLYLGTSSASLSLISSTTFSATAPGKFNTMNYASPTLPGGTTVFVVAQVRDAGTTPLPVWTPLTPHYGNFYGVSQEFSFILGTSAFTYPAMYSQGTTQGTGNWAAGTRDMSSTAPGFFGAIAVSPVPEPTSFAMAGLGMAAMLIFRRRKA
jgi:hypothetical protein